MRLMLPGGPQMCQYLSREGKRERDTGRFLALSSDLLDDVPQATNSHAQLLD